MACPPIRFENIGRERFERMKAGLAARGLAVDADTGEAERDGIRVAWCYDGAALTVQVVKKPRLYPEGMVNHRLREELQKL